MSIEKCLICLSHLHPELLIYSMVKYMLVRETTRTTAAIRQETWGKICREAKESVYLQTS